MKYQVNNRINEANYYPVEWYVTDDIGRWVHNEPFLSKEGAEAFLLEFLRYVESIKAGCTFK